MVIYIVAINSDYVNDYAVINKASSSRLITASGISVFLCECVNASSCVMHTNLAVNRVKCKCSVSNTVLQNLYSRV